MAGRLGDRTGSFVLQHTGTDDGHTTTAGWLVVPGSGTGGLLGLRGEGGAVLARNEAAFGFELDYDLA